VTNLRDHPQTTTAHPYHTYNLLQEVKNEDVDVPPVEMQGELINASAG
jgi:hypothetical protein